ncbi:7094_t:CDS:2, partial [Gigaspora rosea]
DLYQNNGPGTSEIDWTNKLNEYRNVFTLLTEEFKKFAVSQNEKVSEKDKEIAQLLKTDTSINEVAKEMLIEQECGCQDYGIMEITNKMSNLELKKQSYIQKLEIKIEEKTKYELLSSSTNKNSNPTTINICTVETQHKNMVHTFTLWDITSEALPGRYKAVAENIPKFAIETILQRQLKQKKWSKLREKRYFTSIQGLSEKKQNSHEQTATNKQEEKLREHRQETLISKTKT